MIESNEKLELLDRINRALDEIRPHLNGDGGDIELVDVTDDMIVMVKWIGNCEFCSMSAMTMRAGVEQTIKDKLPEINGVMAVNGYYK
ncbi:MAG: NifU family protein [Chitinophagales bacterium]|nr:NifU family protein [Chitinophagales bacterium]